MDGNILNGCSVVPCVKRDLMFQGKFGPWSETTWKPLTNSMYCIQYLLSPVLHWSHCLSNITALLWLHHEIKWKYSMSFSRNSAGTYQRFLSSTLLRLTFRSCSKPAVPLKACVCCLRSSSVRIYTLKIVYVLISFNKGHWTLTFHHHLARKLSIVLTLRLQYKSIFSSLLLR